MATSSISPDVGARQTKRGEKFVTKRGALSCITEKWTTEGRYVGSTYFDVPAETYGAGNLTGLRIAAEFMREAETANPRRNDLFEVMKDAFGALGAPDAAFGRRGAAVGFSSVIEEYVLAAARTFQHEKFIAQRIEWLVDYEREYAERVKAEKMEFARRMEIAKAAKARARRVAEQAVQGGR